MNLTIGMTIHNRQRWMLEAVFASLAHFPGNQPDEMIVMFDRASEEVYETAIELMKNHGMSCKVLKIDGPPWNVRCPAKPWNKVIEETKTDLLAMMSSDCIILPAAVTLTKLIHESYDGDIVCFGKAVHVGPGYARGFFATGGNGRLQPQYALDRTLSDHISMTPRQHFWSMKVSSLRRIGGFDEIFDGGIAYEDTDLSFRLWESGCDFVLCDDIQAFHLEHNRDHLTDGRSEINRKIFMDRYGHEDSFRYKGPRVDGRCDGWSFMTRPGLETQRADETIRAKSRPWWTV